LAAAGRGKAPASNAQGWTGLVRDAGLHAGDHRGASRGKRARSAGVSQPLAEHRDLVWQRDVRIFYLGVPALLPFSDEPAAIAPSLQHVETGGERDLPVAPPGPPPTPPLPRPPAALYRRPPDSADAP